MERESVKVQLDKAQEERLRISLKETEVNERLQETLQKLLQAGVDRKASERETRMREALQNLKRVFPGQSMRSP